MKNFVKRNKEFIIAAVIIIVIVIGLCTKFVTEIKQERKISNKNDIDQMNIVNDIVADEGNYILKNGKLFITFNGKENIEVPGDFSNLKKFEDGKFQISDKKIVFTNHNYEKDVSYIVYSNDNGQNWNTVQMSKNENIQYIEFFSKDIGILYEIEDVAMEMTFGSIKVTSDGGQNWNSVNNGINGTFRKDSKVKFYTKDLGYLTMPYNGGDSCELYMTSDQGKTFTKVETQHSELEDTNLSWKEVYDYYNMPTFKNNVYYLEVGQGSDGDYNGGDSIKYYSYTGLDWSNQKIEKETREELDKKFDERVANRSDKIFLKDFNNYKPQNNDIKISQQEAEKIAEIGFEEASSIGESGSKTSQNVQVEQRTANNFFVMNHNCIHEVYQNILRKCYVFTRENDMGCGSSVYVDVTTGLIIGGECFGD